MSSEAFGFSDTAKRCSDTVTMHAIAGSFGKWAAIRLSDGGSDNVVYDTREDAIVHQLHEELCCYVFIPITGMTPKEAEAFMELNRALYDAGWHMTDPAAIHPVRLEDFRAKIAQLKRNKVR